MKRKVQSFGMGLLLRKNPDDPDCFELYEGFE